jgi:hypothetical protein
MIEPVLVVNQRIASLGRLWEMAWQFAIKRKKTTTELWLIVFISLSCNIGETKLVYKAFEVLIAEISPVKFSRWFGVTHSLHLQDRRLSQVHLSAISLWTFPLLFCLLAYFKTFSYPPLSPFWLHVSLTPIFSFQYENPSTIQGVLCNFIEPEISAYDW